MSQQQRKLSIKDMANLTTQLAKDLRQLQREGMTLPDIIYNYRVQDGRIVRKRPRRRGSYAANEVEGEPERKREEEEASQVEVKPAMPRKPVGDPTCSRSTC